MTSFLEGPDVPLEYVVHGSGEPMTVFAHGLSASIEDTRFLGSGVAGSKLFFHFRGHGDSGVPESGWDYAGVTRDLRAVVDFAETRRVVGISMGAGAILGVLAGSPDRFDRVVLLLPAGLDRPRSDGSMASLSEHADLIEARNVDRLTEYLVDGLPPDLESRPEIRALMRERAEFQLRCGGLVQGLRGLPATPPVLDRGVLRAVTADVLVIAQEDDEVHDAQVAREIADVLPSARLHVFDTAWSMLRRRDELRDLVAGHLNA
jgi:3-oxoadipate enol-lactonase